MKKVRLEFAPGLEVEFTDRDRAVEQVYELAEKGTRFPVVVFGPEGCGKTAWLIQAVEVLKDLGYSVVYFNPLRRCFEAEVGIEDLRRKALEIAREASSELVLAKMVWRVVDLALEALRLDRRRLAVVVDDAFHLIGARESSLLVKGLLELAAFNVHESCQLRLKASLLRILNEIPGAHSMRELLRILSAKLEEVGFVEVSAKIKDFAKLYRDELVDLDSAYIVSRYTFFTFTRGDVEKLAQVCSELHSLLEEVEKSVLG